MVATITNSTTMDGRLAWITAEHFSAVYTLSQKNVPPYCNDNFITALR